MINESDPEEWYFIKCSEGCFAAFENLDEAIEFKGHMDQEGKWVIVEKRIQEAK